MAFVGISWYASCLGVLPGWEPGAVGILQSKMKFFAKFVTGGGKWQVCLPVGSQLFLVARVQFTNHLSDASPGWPS